LIMEISPYLLFNGSCAEAFKLHEKVLGGNIVGLHRFGIPWIVNCNKAA